MTDLLNRHNHLYCVKTVKTKIVMEVRFAVKLRVISIECSGVVGGSVVLLMYP